ncbi:MAG: D-glucuronyl C5-epimerase family protein [Acidobacteriia bacterium]|nr:D-glucuronyl C5-epimerase family protein [Terriglobia bacterium]
MNWKTRTPAAFKCAVRALKKEIFGFSFDYPLYTVPEASEEDSLHYYLYSDALSWEALRLDPNGIPMTWYRVTGAAYWPSYIAWYGLVQLGHYLRRGDEANLKAFLKQVSWLEENAVLRSDGAVVWPMNFDYPNGAVVLKAPWISAYTQGLAISALVRAWRLTRRPELLKLLRRSADVFGLDVKDSGVRVSLDGHTLYTEIPGGPVPGILDGFMTSLIGLHDLYAETKDPIVGRLFEEGIAGLKYALPRWDYGRKWSWYGCRAYLSPPAYHNLNCLLLDVLARLSEQPLLAEYAQQWSPKQLSAFDRTEIYLGFVLTKNANRLRHRTWRQKADKASAPSRMLVPASLPQASVGPE